MTATSVNFAFLADHDPLLETIAGQAERYALSDGNASLIKLRMLGEMLAQQAAAYAGVYLAGQSGFLEVVNRLRDRGVLSPEVSQLFHELRRAGNAAVHQGAGTPGDALHHLRMAREVAVWFHRSFSAAPGFSAGPFVPPPEPGQASREIKAELERLRNQVVGQEQEIARSQQSAAEQARLRQEAEDRANTLYEEAAAALDLAQESEEQAAQQQARYEQQLAALQADTSQAPAAEVSQRVEQAQQAAQGLDIDEAATRKIIDAQLQDAGWEADTAALSYAAGVRPTKGKNLAIAEWPTASGPADYVLFAGLTALAVVEAKRKRKDVAGAIEQAKRYSRDYVIKADETLPGGPWGDYKVPLLFASNGRPYLRQLETKSGIWYLDARRPTNHPRALETWRTPQGMLDLLDQDIPAAEKKLAEQPSDYLPLRDYQQAAVKAAERAIAAGKQEMLLALATGTGKTRLALCLIYRLLKAGRFRRVLFLVDRSALGEQAHNAFKDVRLENLQSLTEIYDVLGLGDLRPEPDTRLHIATVQGMVKRLMYPSDEDQPVPVDWYDCIIVDECHRGYNLDQEMTDSEITFRSESDYISKYRRVLDHFDAVRIGLTATPALHTTEIFGPPIHQYGYRQAVIDGYLVDHEPPIRILTRLNQAGIHWQAGEEVAVYNTGADQLRLFETPDEIDIDVSGFNTAVVTKSFNRVICQKLAEEIDPSLPGKTLIFCATDNHADMVVGLLKEAFTAAYGEVEDDAVQKITGAADKPLDKIRHYKNERLPSVAVTVDLLSTGIDVPRIVNLVFIRRVKSRILYEQMLGRATRLCPDIGKELFRVYDAVDLYAALEPFTSMKPVVTRPHITFAQLAEELTTVADEEHQQAVLDEILAKLQAKKRHIRGEHLDSFSTLAGDTPDALIAALKSGHAASAADYFQQHPDLAPFLDQFKPAGGKNVYVSDHDDELQGTERGYGAATKPEEYLAAFREYIEANKNDIDALLVVTQRPRDLTRQQLRELKLKLDQAGFPVSALRTAWAQVSNQDIAASIIGFIRQQALGSALVPYAQRVDLALLRVQASQQWTAKQRQWLERIGKQMKQEIIVDRDALDRGQFKAQGGFNRLNKVFGGKLEQVLGEIHEELWREVG